MNVSSDTDTELSSVCQPVTVGRPSSDSCLYDNCRHLDDSQCFSVSACIFRPLVMRIPLLERLHGAMMADICLTTVVYMTTVV